MTPVQRTAHSLLQCDFRYIYTILNTERILPPNYSVAMIPYLGLITDGAENWVSAMNRSHPGSVDMPQFTSQEKEFYQAARASIKLWEKTIQKFTASYKSSI